MGFFTTTYDPNNATNVFSVSSRWWYFLALAVPFTIVVLILAWTSAIWSQRQVEQRKKSDVMDLEKSLSYQMTAHDHKSEVSIIPP